MSDVITKTEIARACGLSPKMIDKFIVQGIITPDMEVGKGRTKHYDPVLIMGALVRYYRGLSDNTAAKKKNEPVDLRKNKADADFKRYRADIEELKLKELRGEMHRSGDVEEAFTDFGMAVRSSLLSFPGRLAVNCANADNAAEVADLIKKAVNETLNELMEYQYDPEFYKKRVRERVGWSEDDKSSTEQT